ncbi:MAG: phosphonate degradation HD-domain oxygenase [Leptothrix sp. (in: b-proteobacteria)]
MSPSPSPLTLDQIAALFEQHGGAVYSGEPVTQREHSLQCAARAEAAGADDELITAALLHDIGHLIAGSAHETPTLHGIDDRHQHRALPWLRGRFSARVLGAIELHVDAKRLLCAIEPGYEVALSADSQRSLQLQGGVFNTAQSAQFLARPGAREAIALRRWDDLAKIDGGVTPPLAHYMAIAWRCAIEP